VKFLRPAGPVEAGPRDLAVALLAAFVVGTAITCALFWPLPMVLDSQRPLGVFHDGQIWAFDHMVDQLSGEVSRSSWTFRIGYPDSRFTAFVGWGAAAYIAPLRLVLGPMGAYNLVLFLGPGLSAVSVALLVRRLTGAAPLAAAGAGLAAALSPTVLGFLASGQPVKIQLWTVVLPLLLLAWAVTGPRRVAALVLLPLAGATSAFTAPSLTLYLPFLAGLVVLNELVRERKQLRRPAIAGLLGLGLLAISLLPARAYHAANLAAGRDAAFLPANTLIRPKDPFFAPRLFAQPAEILFGGLEYGTPTDTAAEHVVYLGLLAVGAVLLALLARGRGAPLALAVLMLGTTMALGPHLAHENGWVTTGDGSRLGLPAYALSALGYPLAKSGMYYRAVAIGALGVSLGIGALSTRLHRWPAVAVAWILGLAVVADGVRETRSLWPRACEPPPAHTLMLELAEADEGAVLELPLDAEDIAGERGMLSASLHEQPTSSVPYNVFPDRDERVGRLSKAVEAALATGQAREALVDLGFATVIWRPGSERPTRREDWKERRRLALVDALGPAEEVDGLLVWRLAD